MLTLRLRSGQAWRRLLLAILLVAAAALSLHGLLSVSRGPDCYVAEWQMNDAELRVLQLINEDRAAYGVPPVVPDDALSYVAAVKLVDQHARRMIDHVEAGGRDLKRLLEDCGVDVGWAGEILAQHAAEPEDAFAGWQQSPGHAAIIRGPQYVRAAAAFAARDGIWVVVFADAGGSGSDGR